VVPETRYAKSGDLHVAYQVFGEGPIDLVYAPGFVSHAEVYWEDPAIVRWLEGLASFCRVIMFDKRGTGLSDRVSDMPTMEERMEDVRIVMDAVGVERAAVSGISEGGSLAMMFAASHPERCQALVLYGAFAKFSSWIATDEEFDGLVDYIDNQWGSGLSMPFFAPSRTGDAAFQHWWGRFERLAASPSAAIKLMRMNREIDTSGILSSIQVPTLIIHREDDTLIDVEGGRFLADHIPGARYEEIPGSDHIPMTGDNTGLILELYEEFITGTKSSAVEFDRVLSTVLFTDIVRSTENAEAMGDQRWRELLNTHDTAVRQELNRFRGNEVKALGDGFLTTFDGPARAIRCALAICKAVKPLGIEVRAGLHTGEVELSERDVRGIAVHIASRVAELAGPGETFVSRTVKDLVAGSGINFEDVGLHEIKGVPENWQLFQVVV
jgi:pimeloyl-ACP methyl ester carboxylesterase